ncbi:biotin-dependent carboxyltransferase family protein [Microbispora cellulosiformans]|uniref:Biotin-dependent carboxyltransferase family protein n=1 Tax=Microbispora cellulosiformans TaxID=2614688 RepID=A0A5J5KA52_9ACTN|nr:biotin-dependent carboxyltransferase family protein [Microbispora cellulosiformans]KAA9380897.1 biotin-dependent carboxyltransferase family protein [Microbispora cellulosiformans]
MTARVEVLAPGPYATVQDLGRPGYAHLGVPRSGAADPPSLRLANRLVGNAETAAGIELTLGGAALRFTAGAWVAVTGAPCPVEAAGRAAGTDAPLWVPPGGVLRVGVPRRGLRTYVAVRDGIGVERMLGSRSTDSLSGIGPPPLRAGTTLPVGAGAVAAAILADFAAPPPLPRRPVVRVLPGPRDDWFVPEALTALCAAAYEVTADSNRVGARLRGAPLERARAGELASEGMPLGAVQVPPGGQPIVFLADHPPTGGYPVVGVVAAADLPLVAQARPGDLLRFRLVRRASHDRASHDRATARHREAADLPGGGRQEA